MIFQGKLQKVTRINDSYASNASVLLLPYCCADISVDLTSQYTHEFGEKATFCCDVNSPPHTDSPNARERVRNRHVIPSTLGLFVALTTHVLAPAQRRHSLTPPNTLTCYLSGQYNSNRSSRSYKKLSFPRYGNVPFVLASVLLVTKLMSSPPARRRRMVENARALVTYPDAGLQCKSATTQTPK